MPELPEVEIVKKGLQGIIGKNTLIEKIELKRKDLRFPIPRKLITFVKNKKIKTIKRRAKYLLFELEDDFIIISHLGMTGIWRKLEGDKLIKHDHIILHCSGDLKLVYNDPRRFGILDYSLKSKLTKHKLFSHLGPEPLDKIFDFTYLYEKTRNKQSSIKNLIMNQEIVVGVGNIYAAEALFNSKIKPQRKAKTITKKECELLVKEIKTVIDNAIKVGGSSISDFKNIDGDLGYFQHNFKVYGRDGAPCKICESILLKKIIGGRSSVYCPTCQK